MSRPQSAVEATLPILIPVTTRGDDVNVLTDKICSLTERFTAASVVDIDLCIPLQRTLTKFLQIPLELLF